MKPTIRKAGTKWVLTRPAFGFARADEVTLHESWKAARAALLAAAPATAGASSQVGTYTLGLAVARGRLIRGTIRMEET